VKLKWLMIMNTKKDEELFIVNLASVFFELKITFQCIIRFQLSRLKGRRIIRKKNVFICGRSKAKRTYAKMNFGASVFLILEFHVIHLLDHPVFLFLSPHKNKTHTMRTCYTNKNKKKTGLYVITW